MTVEKPDARIIRHESNERPAKALHGGDVPPRRVGDDGVAKIIIIGGLQQALALGLEAQCLVTREIPVARGEDEHLRTVQMEGVVSLVKVLENNVHHFDLVGANDKLVLLVKGDIVDALDVKGGVARRQAVDDAVDGGRLDLGPEGALVEEASFEPPCADFQVDAEVPRVVGIFWGGPLRPGLVCTRGLVFANDGELATVFLGGWEQRAGLAESLSLVVSNDGLGACDALVWQDVLGEAVLEHARAEPKQARVEFLIGAKENAVPLPRAD